MSLFTLPTAGFREHLIMLTSPRIATLALSAVLLYGLAATQQGMAARSAGISEDAAAGPSPAAPACPAQVTSTLDLPNVPACRQLLTMMGDTRHGCASLKPYMDPGDPLSTCASSSKAPVAVNEHVGESCCPRTDQSSSCCGCQILNP